MKSVSAVMLKKGDIIPGIITRVVDHVEFHDGLALVHYTSGGYLPCDPRTRFEIKDES